MFSEGADEWEALGLLKVGSGDGDEQGGQHQEEQFERDEQGEAER